jgi:hypothetical protein
VVQAECTLKESAAINQILGRRVRTNDDFLIPPPSTMDKPKRPCMEILNV